MVGGFDAFARVLRDVELGYMGKKPVLEADEVLSHGGPLGFVSDYMRRHTVCSEIWCLALLTLNRVFPLVFNTV